ncbi:Rix1 complex component involved in 60S ribosome maturation domain containing protein [Elaphomyces granulatus]
MGSSQKKKREKQKDFLKSKLKVGKSRPKASNYTDTSFRSKAIVINQQSLKTDAPSTSTQFSHHISLLSSKSDVQRRESLAHLTTAIASRPVDSPLPQPVSLILPSVLPLFLDGSNAVRSQLLKLLRTFPTADVEGHISQILPYIRAGMTHLAVDIRVSAVEVLSWLVSAVGPEVVSCAGGWVKTLNCFLSLLGWHTEESAKWSANRISFGKHGTEGKLTTKALQALADFLLAGIGRRNDSDKYSPTTLPWIFPLDSAVYHTIPSKTSLYDYLNLFGQPRDAEGEMYEHHEDRYRIFRDLFLKPIERGVENARKEGGDVGRASAALAKVLTEASLSEGS